MKWSAFRRHRAATTFVLLFFLVFAALGSVLAAEAIRVYESIDARADDTHAQAVPLDYLAGAARRADAGGRLAVTQLTDGGTALLAPEDGTDWLYYCRDGYLYKQDASRSAASAERLCQAGTLRLRDLDGLIRADYTAPDGGKETLLLYPRSAGGEETR